jgi:predicted transposase/invertase (TIGR01784 family)
LQLHDLKTLTEKWVYFIKNAENLEVIPENINDEGLKSAYEEANVQTWTQEELDAYEYAFMREEDERARLDKAKQYGKEEGQEEAVLGLFNNGVSIELIAKSLKLPEDKVRKIVENQRDK